MSDCLLCGNDANGYAVNIEISKDEYPMCISCVLSLLPPDDPARVAIHQKLLETFNEELEKD